MLRFCNCVENEKVSRFLCLGILRTCVYVRNGRTAAHRRVAAPARPTQKPWQTRRPHRRLARASPHPSHPICTRHFSKSMCRTTAATRFVRCKCTLPRRDTPNRHKPAHTCSTNAHKNAQRVVIAFQSTTSRARLPTIPIRQCGCSAGRRCSLPGRGWRLQTFIQASHPAPTSPIPHLCSMKRIGQSLNAVQCVLAVRAVVHFRLAYGRNPTGSGPIPRCSSSPQILPHLRTLHPSSAHPAPQPPLCDVFMTFYGNMAGACELTSSRRSPVRTGGHGVLLR